MDINTKNQPLICGLIRSRHAVPSFVSFFVFEGDIPQAHVCDSAYMEAICRSFLDKHRPSSVSVYVTGFTPALLALVKVCNDRNIGLNAFNYDRQSRNFWEQEVL